MCFTNTAYVLSVIGDTVDPGLPHVVVDAPCTIQNQRLCSWLEIHGLQVTLIIRTMMYIKDVCYVSLIKSSKSVIWYVLMWICFKVKYVVSILCMNLFTGVYGIKSFDSTHLWFAKIHVNQHTQIF